MKNNVILLAFLIMSLKSAEIKILGTGKDEMEQNL